MNSVIDEDINLKYHQLIYENLHENVLLIEIEDLKNKRFKILRINKFFSHKNGFDTKNFLGKYVDEVMPKEISDDVIAYYLKCIESEKPISYLKWYEVPNGNFAFLNKVIPIKENSEIKYILVVSNDVTELKKAQEEIEKKESRLRLITEHITDLVSEVNTLGCFTYISPSLTTLLGYNISDLLNTNYIDLIHPEDRKDLIKELQIIIKSKEVKTVIFRVRHKSGNYFWFECTAKATFDKNTGNHTGYMAVSRDVTDRKKLQDKLREYINELERLNNGDSLEPMSLDEIKLKISKNTI